MAWILGSSAAKIRTDQAVPLEKNVRELEFITPQTSPKLTPNDGRCSARLSPRAPANIFDDSFMAPWQSRRTLRTRATTSPELPKLKEALAAQPIKRSVWQQGLSCIAGLLWWVRRLIGDSLRAKDAASVELFLAERGLYRSDTKTFTCAFDAELLNDIGMRWQFWWLSAGQVQAIADASRSLLCRAEAPSQHDEERCIEVALFGRELRHKQVNVAQSLEKSDA